MEPEAQVEKEAVVPTATPEPSVEKDPVKEELDRIEAKPKRSKLETLEFTKKRVEQQLEEERAKLGIKPEDTDDRPLTVREFNALQEKKATETALTKADAIEDENERKLTIYHLENTIKPSGDPDTDLRNARLIVNAVKNGQIAEEATRAIKPRTAGSSPSAPPKETTKQELTAEERALANAFHLTDEEVLAQRPKE